MTQSIPQTLPDNEKFVKTLKLRVKDKHAAVLGQMAREVNTVWNFVNETSQRAIRERHQFMTGYDLQKYTAGYCKCDGVLVGWGTVDSVCAEFATRRKVAKRARLNWRVSNPKSPKRSLGWVPFKAKEIRYKGGQVRIAGHTFSLWDSYGLADYELRAGCFSQDSRGRWYLNVAVQVNGTPSAGTAAIGLDLGLKTAVTASTGQKIEQRLHPVALVRHGYEKARRIGMMAMVGGKDKTRIRNATPPEFKEMLLALGRCCTTPGQAQGGAE